MPRIYYYHLALLGFFGLFFLWMAWPTVLQPSSTLPTALILIVTVGPLLLPFRGFLDRNLKSCTWMSYLSLPYFVHGVVEAYAGDAALIWSLTETFFALLLCFGAGFYVYTAEKKPS